MECIKKKTFALGIFRFVIFEGAPKNISWAEMIKNQWKTAHSDMPKITYAKKYENRSKNMQNMDFKHPNNKTVDPIQYTRNNPCTNHTKKTKKWQALTGSHVAPANEWPCCRQIVRHVIVEAMCQVVQGMYQAVKHLCQVVNDRLAQVAGSLSKVPVQSKTIDNVYLEPTETCYAEGSFLKSTEGTRLGK